MSNTIQLGSSPEGQESDIGGSENFALVIEPIKIPVNRKRVEYPAVIKGMERERVKPLRTTYVKNGEGET